METPHVPVLSRQVAESFGSIEGGVVVDCTLGYGGHSKLLLESHKELFLIGIDRDKTAIEFSKKRLAEYKNRTRFLQGCYSECIKEVLCGDVHGILADIGVSSLQLDQRERGFSFESDTLDMRMDSTAQLSAAEVVNEYSHDALTRILREYGEINSAAHLAERIIAKRPFYSAKELSALLPKRKKGTHPATQLFQAIRIEVNDELGELTRLLDVIENSPLKQATIAIISFHSLEDRIVKQRFAKWAKRCICDAEAMRCTCGNNHAIGKVVTKKPVTADEDELKANPRSRSAKLRVFELCR